MFASFKSETRSRATQILSADHPNGPFLLHGEEPITPKDWECLDGTFYIDQKAMNGSKSRTAGCVPYG